MRIASRDTPKIFDSKTVSSRSGRSLARGYAELDSSPAFRSSSTELFRDPKMDPPRRTVTMGKPPTPHWGDTTALEGDIEGEAKN